MFWIARPPRVILRTWATASRVGIGFARKKRASGLENAGCGSRKVRAKQPVVKRNAPAVGVRPRLPAAQREAA